jgi:SseB protein C-terminal domain/SseB protein N-terminal domain
VSAPPAQNRLEELLAEAAEDEEARTRFYEELLRSELYGIVKLEGDVEQVDAYRARLSEGAGVKLLPLDVDGEPVYALFTSPLRVEQATGGGLPFAGMPAATAFSHLPAGRRAVLNPGVWYGKELLPGEIEDLAAGRVPGAGLGTETIPAGADVMLGLPAEPPERLVEELHRHFATVETVKSARLGQIHVPAGALPPHPVVGVEVADGAPFEDALADVHAVARRAHDGPVDFVPLAGNDIGAWLRQNVSPFYEHSSGGR